MATVQRQAGTRVRVSCDIPRCVDKRLARGQDNGRFLFTLDFGESTVTVTIQCPECGATHTVTQSLPLTT